MTETQVLPRETGVDEGLYPSVDEAKKLLTNEYGEGLTFKVNAASITSGYAQVEAYRDSQYVGKVVMQKSPYSNSSHLWQNNSGRYMWSIQ